MLLQPLLLLFFSRLLSDENGVPVFFKKVADAPQSVAVKGFALQNASSFLLLLRIFFLPLDLSTLFSGGKKAGRGRHGTASLQESTHCTRPPATTPPAVTPLFFFFFNRLHRVRVSAGCFALHLNIQTRRRDDFPGTNLCLSSRKPLSWMPSGFVTALCTLLQYIFFLFFLPHLDRLVGVCVSLYVCGLSIGLLGFHRALNLSN